MICIVLHLLRECSTMQIRYSGRGEICCDLVRALCARTRSQYPALPPLAGAGAGVGFIVYLRASGTNRRALIVMIVKVAVFDAPPPGPGLLTVMLPWPPSARSAALTSMRSLVGPT